MQMRGSCCYTSVAGIWGRGGFLGPDAAGRGLKSLQILALCAQCEMQRGVHAVWSADRSRLSRAASEVWPRALARLDGEGASSDFDDEIEVIPT